MANEGIAAASGQVNPDPAAAAATVIAPVVAAAAAPKPGEAGAAGAAAVGNPAVGTVTGGEGGAAVVPGVKPAAPDVYTLAIPEGSKVDAHDVTVIEKLAKANGWSNDEAQAALELHHANIEEQRTAFLAATKADKDYGGEHLAIAQKRANAIIDRIRPASHPRSAAFRAIMEKTGYGNHVEILSFLADVGKLSEEDGGVTGSSGGGEQKSLPDRLYPSTVSAG